MILKCKYCGRECKNENSLRNHERLCKQNPNRQILKSNFIEYNKKRKEQGIKGTNHYTKAKELGLPKPIVSDETKQKLAKVWKGKQHSEETKQKISKGIRKAIQEHPESYSSCNVNGRVKNVIYNGIKLDGKWELEVAKYLDKNNIQWERPSIGIEYEWNNKIHLYFPDFYLSDYNTYIEVKGLIRERDYAKWKNINNLIVIKAKEINDIRNESFDIYKYMAS